MGIEQGYYSLGRLDDLSYGGSLVHRLDPRAKILTTGLFAVVAVSYGKYETVGLLPLFFYPMAIAVVGEVPLSYIARKLLYLSPFPILIGVFNPLLDRGPGAVFMGVGIWGGWVSFASIMLKFALTTSAALLLVATTPFPMLCAGLRRLALPKVFVSQLMFIYRYIFLFIAEAMRMLRAREQRRFGGRRMDIREFAGLTGVLFIRAYERAGRVYAAMLARGFDGSLKTPRELSFGIYDAAFVAAVSAVLILLRWFDITRHIGDLVLQ